ncbi:response regulator transcription factor [Fulvimarina sp. 2208YS6-2-32]|uniref:Response regulator transcription factor n=1 Tax=Fulvimarina uroteuthidis TaxID=3098149 RepID=A0ABU5I1S7_9HYPH|nr:response regulator transcription factor [Fulvimarina sp. 2208YS6-2-32]MDY8108774.1 response regulator transcription factor [Fulvimarina sp. 2208YS6-2-32]
MSHASIAFIDDHPILRDGLVSLFSELREYCVVGSGACAADAITVAAEKRPDILVIDLQMPGNALDAIARIRTKSPSMKIVAFTASDRTDLAIAALEAGANGYVLKGSTVAELTAAIESAMRGETFVTPALASKMIAALRLPSSREAASRHLSVREEQIVKLLLKGCTNKAIAARLDISEKTVKHYMTSLMHKLDARNRLEVVLAAQRLVGIESGRDARNPGSFN